MQEQKKNWLNILFLSLTPVVGIAGTAAYALARGVVWWEPVLFLTLFGLVSFSVTAGYHRCFSHKSYVSRPALQAIYLFFGTMAFQNSASPASGSRPSSAMNALKIRPANSGSGVCCGTAPADWRRAL